VFYCFLLFFNVFSLKNDKLPSRLLIDNHLQNDSFLPDNFDKLLNQAHNKTSNIPLRGMIRLTIDVLSKYNLS
jgi:hypothetical protein